MPELLILPLSDLSHLAELISGVLYRKKTFSGENEEYCLLLF